jgi:hypothetical protein
VNSDQESVHLLLGCSHALANASIDNYQWRGFTQLMQLAESKGHVVSAVVDARDGDQALRDRIEANVKDQWSSTGTKMHAGRTKHMSPQHFGEDDQGISVGHVAAGSKAKPSRCWSSWQSILGVQGRHW